MSNWSLLLIWLSIYLGVIVFMPVPYRNLQQGYLWRFLQRWVPPFNMWKGPQHLYSRFFTFAAVLIGIQLMLPARAGITVYWTSLLVQHFDDYFNGDDDERKKRWEKVKNKIRWQVPKPAPQKASVNLS